MSRTSSPARRTGESAERRMREIARIHILKKQLGMDDDTYRDFLGGMTGKRSSKDMTGAERVQVITAMERSTGKAQPSGPKLDFPQYRKMQAMWIAMWNLGMIESRSNASMLKFAQRIARVDRPEWVAPHAERIIANMRQWMSRPFPGGGGVDWSKGERGASPWIPALDAQCRILVMPKAIRIAFRAYAGASKEQAQDVMNKLGKEIRAIKKGDIENGY